MSISTKLTHEVQKEIGNFVFLITSYFFKSSGNQVSHDSEVGCLNLSLVLKKKQRE